MITDKILAARISEMLWQISGQLDTSIADVRDTCSDEEFKSYRRGAAKVMAEIYFELLRPLYKTHPDLEPEELKGD